MAETKRETAEPEVKIKVCRTCGDKFSWQPGERDDVCEACE